VSIIEVRHPETGIVSRVHQEQYDRYLLPQGFTVVETQAAPVPDAPQRTEESAAAPEWEIEGLSATALESLIAADLTSREALAAASDDDLLALDGIGPASVERIRAYINEE
jgi:hypothetical protein